MIISAPMFKLFDIRRIQAALLSKDMAELLWAASYCKMQMTLAEGSHQVKYWGLTGRLVNEAIAESENPHHYQRKAA